MTVGQSGEPVGGQKRFEVTEVFAQSRRRHGGVLPSGVRRQTRGASSYAEPVLYNADHTISLKADATKFLYGPYGDQWVCWGDNENVLIVELVD